MRSRLYDFNDFHDDGEDPWLTLAPVGSGMCGPGERLVIVNEARSIDRIVWEEFRKTLRAPAPRNRPGMPPEINRKAAAQRRQRRARKITRRARQ